MLKWIEHRTGAGALLKEALFENIPGGSRWRYVWGSTLTFTFFVQIITGIILWMAYSPSVQTAWESVFYIQYEMAWGWLLRGVHHYTAQAMIILLILHLMQVVIDGAYKAPREVNFWFGIGLLVLVLALSLTGYLLPWDQKGFWATKVTTAIMAHTPVIGAQLERVVVGGAEYGHHTLTRFFALHAGVLPALVVLLVVGHIYLFRRHGITPKQPHRGPNQMFWPDQVLKDAVACLAVMAAILFFVVKAKFIGGEGAHLGAHLGPPAEPYEPYDAPRPEWYFLFLFQLIKLPVFGGENQVYGAIVLPSVIMFVICLMPFIGRWRRGHLFNLWVLSGLFGSAAVLTIWAIAQDRRNPEYLAAAEKSERDAERVRVLANSPTKIPESGAISLLRNDPLTQGPKIFAAHCASCHRYDGHDGTGEIPTDDPSAPDLKGFATREWLTALLNPDQYIAPKYFGNTAHVDGKMYKSFLDRKVRKFDDEETEQLKKIVIALSAEAQLKSQQEADTADAEIIEQGKTHLLDDIACADCHEFHFEDEDMTAPDLTGYGSRDWTIGFVTNPEHEKFYGSGNDRMPAYGDEEILRPKQIEMVVDWLRGDWYEPESELP